MMRSHPEKHPLPNVGLRAPALLSLGASVQGVIQSVQLVEVVLSGILQLPHSVDVVVQILFYLRVGYVHPAMVGY